MAERLAQIFAQMKTLAEQNKRAQTLLSKRAYIAPSKRQNISKEVAARENKMVALLDEVHLNSKIIARIVVRLKIIIKKIENHRANVEMVERRTKLKLHEIESHLAKMRKNPKFRAKYEKEWGLNALQLAEAVKVARESQKAIKNLEKESDHTVEKLTKTYEDILLGEHNLRVAKSELVEANLRLVVSIAKKYTNRGLQF